MWLSDLEKAIAYLREKRDDFNLMCIKEITPTWDGNIVFHTTHHTYIKVYRNGTIEEKQEGDWRK